MGMTIDEAMLNLYDIQGYYNDDMQDGYVGFDREDNESVNIAIKTMCKYQQIEQILKDIPYGGEATVRRIQEVVKDGNDS